MNRVDPSLILLLGPRRKTKHFLCISAAQDSKKGPGYIRYFFKMELMLDRSEARPMPSIKSTI